MNLKHLKKLLLVGILTAFHASADNPETGLQTVAPNAITTVCNNVSGQTDGLNWQSFIFDCTATGDFYVNFWLNPARHEDNTFSSYRVYVNGTEAGHITPTAPNWQSAALDGDISISLKEGTNYLTLAVEGPETPGAEFARISPTRVGAVAPSDGYDDYIARAIDNESVDDNSTESYTPYENEALSTNYEPEDMEEFKGLPLKYSFYGIYTFTQNQEVIVTTSSKAKHVVDIFYMGGNTNITPTNNSGSYSTSSIGTGVVPVPYDTISNRLRKATLMRYDSDKTQDIGKSEGSRTSKNNQGLYTALLRFNIPLDGYYMIKVRSLDNRVLSTANVHIQGLYAYDNVPIYYSRGNLTMAPESLNLLYTKSKNTKDADPYLFVEGGGYKDYPYGRIVAFDDDASDKWYKREGLGNYDSAIEERFKMRTQQFHVCNYSSNNPETTCDVTWKLLSSSQPSRQKAEVSETPNAFGQIPSTRPMLRFENPAAPSTAIRIINGVENAIITAYSISGTLVGKVEIQTNDIISFCDLNVTTSGTYIIRAESAGKVESYKVIINN